MVVHIIAASYIGAFVLENHEALSFIGVYSGMVVHVDGKPYIRQIILSASFFKIIHNKGCKSFFSVLIFNVELT